MLPLSGSADLGQQVPLEWAVANVNHAGGVAGARVELALADLSSEDVATAARRLLADASVLAVIGPDTSAAAVDVAPWFIQARKPLISPSATSGDLFRMFAGKKYFWRTVESDISQVQTLVLLASRAGAHRVALLSSGDSYGNTFFDWALLFAGANPFESSFGAHYDTGLNTWLADEFSSALVQRAKGVSPWALCTASST